MGRERLLALDAALHRELESVLRSAEQVRSAVVRVREAPEDGLLLFGLAALLDTTYSGAEKVLTRALSAFEGVPNGESWHRELLDAATLTIPNVRPPVIQTGTARLLDPYRGFRHRFRNLYLHDLVAEPVVLLATDLEAATTAFAADLAQFREAIRQGAAGG